MRGVMRWHVVLVSLLASGLHAFTPPSLATIRWGGLTTERFLLAPKAFLNKALVPPQQLMIRDQLDGLSAKDLPSFTAKPDQTIIWNPMGWCLEAGGSKDGDVVRVNHCTGGPFQKWNVLLGSNGRQMIQLKETNKCVDVSFKDGALNAVPTVMRECEHEMTQSWRFEELLHAPSGGPSQHLFPLCSLRHGMISVTVAAVLGALMVSVWVRRLHNQARSPALRQGSEIGSLLNVPAAWGNGCAPVRCQNTVSDLQAAVPAVMTVSPSPIKDLSPDVNAAKYLVDLHDNSPIFNFCGGMPFQLVLTEKLRNHLVKVAESDSDQPVIFDASKWRMDKIPGYSQSADADNTTIFHGREIRNVPHAEGGGGMVLQLSYSDGDPEGWTQEEVIGYDGWGHDSGRTWRKGERLENEGFQAFRNKFGPDAFSLHHRFYLHSDITKQLWLSAEDGCEGTPAPDGVNTSLLNLWRCLVVLLGAMSLARLVPRS